MITLVFTKLSIRVVKMLKIPLIMYMVFISKKILRSYLQTDLSVSSVPRGQCYKPEVNTTLFTNANVYKINLVYRPKKYHTLVLKVPDMIQNIIPPFVFKPTLILVPKV